MSGAYQPMRTRIGVILACTLLFLAGCGGGSVNSSSSGSGGSTTAAAWTSVTVPSTISTNGANYAVEADGNLYAMVHSGTAPNIVLSVQRTSATNPGTWTDITGTGLSNGSNGVNGSEFLDAMTMMPNGTILVAAASGSSGNLDLADVYFWNPSTSSTPVWTKVSGWTGSSPGPIYGFTNDSMGYTYFSPTWSGDIWRNTAPNSTTFTKVVTNLYGITGGGAGLHGTTGGIYALSVFNLNGADTMWACGEGQLNSITLSNLLSLTAAGNTAYLTTAQGYTGNCTAVDKSPTTILALRQSSTQYETLTGINIATRATTVHSASLPRTSTGFPGNINMNYVDTLHWVSGTNWILTQQDANTTTLNYLLLSTDDGNTWTDMTAISGINSSCQGSNLSVGAVTTSTMTSTTGQYVYARCQGGAVLWRYGPLS